MSALRRAPQLSDRSLALVAVAGAAGVGGALAVALYAYPPTLPVAAVGGIGLVAALAIALARVHVAVALGFVLLALGRVEPALSDAVFCVVMLVTLLSGRVQLRAVPRPVIGLLVAWAALNVMSSVEVTDVTHALTFFSLSLYLVLLALWLPGYVVSAGRARLVVRAYLFAAVISSVAGVLAGLGLVPGADVLADEGRARALLPDPDVFGAFLVPAALIVAEEIVHPRVLRATTLTKGLALLALVLGVLFSASLGAWLNAVVAFAVLGVVVGLRDGARRSGRLVPVIAALALVLAVSGVQPVTPSAAGDTVLAQARQYPLGAGPGQFESIAGASPRNTYARSVVEQGFPGAAVLVALLGVTLAIGVANVARARDTHGIGSAALLAAWCGLLVQSAFVDALHWRLLWVVAALIWAGAIRSRAGPRSSA